MNCPIDVILVPHLKGLESRIGKLPGLPSQSLIKLKQGSSFIYLNYTENQEVIQSRAELSSKLCEINGIKNGGAKVQSIVGVVECKRVTAWVKEIDWQLINDKSSRIEEQFLNQINVVWPGAHIPLFYDRNNSVILRIQCEKVSLLVENSELEILVERKEGSEVREYEQETKEIQFSSLLTNVTEFGNINTIRVSPQNSFISNDNKEKDTDKQIRMKFIQTKPQGIPTHTYNMTVHEQLEIVKHAQKQNQSQTRNQILLPVIVEFDQKLKDDQISISTLIPAYYGIDETYSVEIKVKTKTKTKMKKSKEMRETIKSLKLEFLINSIKNLAIEIEIVQRQQSEKCFESIKSQFIHFLMKEIKKCIELEKSLTIYGKIPITFGEGHVGFLNFRDKNERSIGDPLSIIFGDQINLQQVEGKLRKLITVKNCSYPIKEEQINTPTNKQAYNLLKLEKMHKKELNQFIIRPPQFFIDLYKICYSREITKILSLIQEDSDLRFILVTSFGNNGKTVLHSIIKDHGYESLYIDMAQFDDTSLTIGDINVFLEMCFQLWSGEFIFMDNLDAVCYKIDAGDLHRKQERIAAKLIIRKILNLGKIYRKVCVMTAKNQGNIDEELRNFEQVKLRNPNLDDRTQVLRKIGKYEKQKIDEMAESSESMSFGEFSKYAITGQKPEAIGQGSKKIKNDFSRLAGLKQAKNKIRSIIYKPLKYSFVFKNLPVKLSRAVLLYGGSGTGKSAVGASLADQFQMKFFSVKGSDILSKYIGGSEAAVRDIFEKAMSVSPSVIFFDEFETIVPRRNSSNTGVTDRVVNQFLCYLDGVASIEGVFIVAASSRPELIDPALLRPGRIDSHIFLDYPNQEQRRELLSLYSSSVQFQTEVEEVIQLTEDFSYSDLIGLIKELRIKRSAEILKKQGEEGGEDPSPQQFKLIPTDLFKEILSTFKVSVSKKQQKKQRQAFLAFERGDGPDVSKQKTMLH